jgi:DNA-binding transcriptional ArsR family regulator
MPRRTGSSPQPLLLDLLARGPASSAALSQALGVSQPTASRLLQALERGGRVVRFGNTRGARYGLARVVGRIGSEWPLYRIDEAGTPEQIASLHAIAPNGYIVSGGPSRVRGMFEGLPYYLEDARPAGFLGRAIPAAYPELALPPRVVDWSDAHVLAYLTQRGSESVGNLILGTEALNRYLRSAQSAPIVPAGNRAATYPQLASQAMFGAPPGSSAHGEHPKFSARVDVDGALVHVLVKFSPPVDTPVGLRWADLLISEHIALATLSDAGVATASSEICEFQGQVFLESRRFDRVPDDGRRGVASLLSVSTAWHGEIDRWSAAARRLHADDLLSADDAERLVLLDTFGALIANTDRHFGNVTLFDDYEGRFRLAPVYDMLPMLFAPQDGQLLEREFEPPPPSAESLAIWGTACELAERYWARLSAEPRLSADFRRRSERAAASIRRLGTRARPLRE